MSVGTENSPWSDYKPETRHHTLPGISGCEVVLCNKSSRKHIREARQNTTHGTTSREDFSNLDSKKARLKMLTPSCRKCVARVPFLPVRQRLFWTCQTSQSCEVIYHTVFLRTYHRWGRRDKKVRPMYFFSYSQGQLLASLKRCVRVKKIKKRDNSQKSFSQELICADILTTLVRVRTKRKWFDERCYINCTCVKLQNKMRKNSLLTVLGCRSRKFLSLSIDSNQQPELCDWLRIWISFQLPQMKHHLS